MSYIEIIGLIASVLVVISLLPKTTNYKGTIFMRVLNLLGSALFVVYGALLPTISTGIANGCLVLINIFYLIKESCDCKKSTNKEEPKDNDTDSSI